MDTQFSESNIHLDDPETEYHCSPINKSTGFNQLHKLILYNHIINQYNKIKELINIHPELINQPTTTGWTALMIAAANARKYDLLAIVKLLLSNPVTNVNAKQLTGWTALMIAAKNSNILSTNDVVSLLIQHDDIDVNLCNKRGETALILSSMYSNTHSNIETVNMLIQHPNININHKNTRGNTALMLAAYKSNIDSNIQTVNLLLDHPNCNINMQNMDGSTSLMIAARFSNSSSNIETLELLLNNVNHIVDCNLQDNKGWTALMFAIGYMNVGSSIDTVKALLKRPHNFNLMNTANNTALMMATRNDDLDIVDVLLNDSNINVDHVDDKFRTELDYAIGSNNLKLVELLCAHGSKLANTSYTINRLRRKEKHAIIGIVESYKN